jgi:hypothetical protein
LGAGDSRAYGFPLGGELRDQLLKTGDGFPQILQRLEWGVEAWSAAATGIGALISTAGEGATFGLDTPVTISFVTLTDFYGASSYVAGAASSGLRSFSNGNLSALRNFDVSSMVNLAAQAASSKFSSISKWGERIGDLAQQATDVALEARNRCP